MRKSIFLLSIVCLPWIAWGQVNEDKLDPAIDNMGYWKKMAEKGLTKLNPNLPVEKATFLGTAIPENANVFAQDSPDVLINNTNNNTQSENSIFANPNSRIKALNSNNSGNINPTNFLGTSSFQSDNGGDSWTGSINGAGGANNGDPATAISTDGRYYIGSIASNLGQQVAISTNEGSNWSRVQIANPPVVGGILDKNHLWVDNSPTSPFQGNVYAAWTPFGGANNRNIELARSTDNGQTWIQEGNISNSGTGTGSLDQGVNISTGPNGEVYAAWTIYDTNALTENAIGFTRSTNGGNTFANSARAINNIRGIRSNGVSKNMRVNSFPSMAVDISNGPNRGNIYIVWANIGVPGTNTGSDMDIYLIRSTNGGNTWSAPLRVNQDPTGQGKQHYFPWITCDPVTGNLAVVFYDDRNVAATQVEAYVATSTDGGTNWQDFRVSDVAFTPQPIPGLAPGYFGDYLGISAYNGIVYPVWTDNRSGVARAYCSPFVFSSCINNVVLQNVTVNTGQTVSEQASNQITVAGGSSFYRILGNGSSGGNVTFTAGSRVLLGPGFEAQAGSQFTASIAACSTTATDIVKSPAIPEGTTARRKVDVLQAYPEAFVIHPNPHQGKFVVTLGQNIFESKGRVGFHVHDLMGRTVVNYSIEEAGDIEVSLGEKQKGVYLVKLYRGGEEIAVRRVLYR